MKSSILSIDIDSAILKTSNEIINLRHSLPRKSLVTIYKAFLSSVINYIDIIYGKPQNKSFCEKLESM